MKTRLLLIFILLGLTAIAFPQKPAKKPLSLAQQFIVKKQIFADDAELQLKDIPYAAVRIYIRYKLAEWLWKKGKDDTARAEALAVKAVEELYAKKDEVQGSFRYKLITDVFALLDANAAETSVKLKAKYEFSLEEDLYSGFSQLTKKDGDRIVAQKILKALAGPGEINGTIFPLLNRLRTMRSPQFPVVLAAFLEVVESGRVTVNNGMLYLYYANFDDPQAPPAMRTRYFALIVGRARRAVLKPEGDYPVVYEMLLSAINDFGDLAPDLMPEAIGLKNALAVNDSKLNKARREAQERVDASLDKLAAAIEEAERAEDPVIKRMFFIQAGVLAKKSGKHEIAIDVIDRLRLVEKSEFMDYWSDQEYIDVARLAFEKNEVETALKATERVENSVRRAEAWKAAAVYFDGKKDPVAARDAIAKTLKLLAEGDSEDITRVYALVRAIPVVRDIDKISLPESFMLAAKAINDLPAPGFDDKPGTKKYTDYVSAIMTLNFNLSPVITVLLAKDKADASDLTERIQKREVRIVADLVLAIDTLEKAQKEAEKKAAKKKAAGVNALTTP